MFRVVLFFCFLLVWLVGVVCVVVVAFCFALLHGTQDFSALTRDCTCALCGGSTVLTTGLPGRSLSGCWFVIVDVVVVTLLENGRN